MKNVILIFCGGLETFHENKKPFLHGSIVKYSAAKLILLRDFLKKKKKNHEYQRKNNI